MYCWHLISEQIVDVCLYILEWEKRLLLSLKVEGCHSLHINNVTLAEPNNYYHSSAANLFLSTIVLKKVHIYLHNGKSS